MPHAVLPIRYIRILSLDVVLGACIGSLFFARILQVSLPPTVIYMLATCVWIIYTVDHLSDARKISMPALTVRHAFHQNYFKTLFLIALIFILSDLVVLFFIPWEVTRAGIFLSSAVALYFIVMRLFPTFFTYAKELLAAFLYTAGICLPAVSLYPGAFSANAIMAFFQFFLIVFLNLLSFSYTDYQIDMQERHASLAVKAGRKSLFCIIRTIAVIFLLSFPLEYFYFNVSALKPEHIVLFLMGLPFLVAACFPKIMNRADAFRAVGDSVFLLPLFVLVFY